MKINKTQFKDEKGRYIVQGLFLEDRYNTELAVYTLDGVDKVYKGKTFPSLKRLYLEMADPEEYTFAQTHLFDWGHWQRLCKNSIVSKHIEQWREELNLMLRSEGIATLVHLAKHENSYQAAKWLADEGFIKKSRGRPSKEDIEAETKRKAKIDEEFQDDFKILELHQGGKK